MSDRGDPLEQQPGDGLGGIGPSGSPKDFRAGKPRVFISYSSVDENIARDLANVLRANEIDVWIDLDEVGFGDSIPARISDGLERCETLLVLVSQHILTSAWSRAEWEAGLSQEIETGRVLVIPVLLDDAPRPPLLAAKRYVDLRDGRINDQLPDLISSIRGTKTIQQVGVRSATGHRDRVRPVFATPVPPPPPEFFGRRAEFAQLRHAASKPGILALVGDGGMGKSSLALQYIREHARDHLFVAWLNASDRATLRSGLASIGDFLDISGEAGTAERAVQLLAKASQWLLVLDDAAAPEELVDLLPAFPQGVIIVTSRDRAWLAAASPSINLGMIADDEAVDWLTTTTGQDDPVALTAISQQLGGLPLALAVASSYMQQTGALATAYLSMLSSSLSHSLLEKAPPVGYPTRLADVWQASIRVASADKPDAIRCLRVASLLADAPIDLRMLVDEDHDVAAAQNVTEVLARMSLVQFDGTSFRLHKILAAAIRQSMGTEETIARLDSIVVPLLNVMPHDHLTFSAQRVAAGLVRHARMVLSHDLMTQCTPGKMIALAHNTAKLCTFNDPELSRSLFALAVKVHEPYVEEQPVEHAALLHGLAIETGSDSDEAIRLLRRAQALLGSHAPPWIADRVASALAVAQGRLGQRDEALRVLNNQVRAQLAVSEEKQDHSPFLDLAPLYADMGRYRLAARLCSAALLRMRRDDPADSIQIIETRTFLLELNIELGNIADAVTDTEKLTWSLTNTPMAGDTSLRSVMARLAVWLTRGVMTITDTGDTDMSMRALAAIESLANVLDDKAHLLRMCCELMGRIAQNLLTEDRAAEAEGILHRAVELYRTAEDGDSLVQGQLLAVLGIAERSAGHLAQARTSLREAADVLRGSESIPDQVIVRRELALTAAASADQDEELYWMREAYGLLAESPDMPQLRWSIGGALVRAEVSSDPSTLADMWTFFLSLVDDCVTRLREEPGYAPAALKLFEIGCMVATPVQGSMLGGCGRSLAEAHAAGCGTLTSSDPATDIKIQVAKRSFYRSVCIARSECFSRWGSMQNQLMDLWSACLVTDPALEPEETIRSRRRIRKIRDLAGEQFHSMWQSATFDAQFPAWLADPRDQLVTLARKLSGYSQISVIEEFLQGDGAQLSSDDGITALESVWEEDGNLPLRHLIDLVKASMETTLTDACAKFEERVWMSAFSAEFSALSRDGRDLSMLASDVQHVADGELQSALLSERGYKMTLSMSAGADYADETTALWRILGVLVAARHLNLDALRIVLNNPTARRQRFDSAIIHRDGELALALAWISYTSEPRSIEILAQLVEAEVLAGGSRRLDHLITEFIAATAAFERDTLSYRLRALGPVSAFDVEALIGTLEESA